MDRFACNTPKTVVGILAGAADQQILLLVNEIGSFIFAHLEIGCELDRIGRAGFLAIAAEDAAREVDAKEFRVPATVLVLRLLKRNAAGRAGDGAQITCDAPFRAVGVA